MANVALVKRSDMERIEAKVSRTALASLAPVALSLREAALSPAA